MLDLLPIYGTRVGLPYTAGSGSWGAFLTVYGYNINPPETDQVHEHELVRVWPSLRRQETNYSKLLLLTIIVLLRLCVLGKWYTQWLSAVEGWYHMVFWAIYIPEWGQCQAQ